MEAHGQSRASALEACLIFVAQEYGQPTSLASLRANSVGPTCEIGIDDAVRAAEHLGFTVALGEIALTKLDADMLPAILIGSEGRAVLVVSRAQDKVRVLNPAISSSEPSLVAVSELRKTYSGQVIFLRQRDTTQDGGEALSGNSHWFWSTLLKSKWSYSQVVLAAAVSNVLGLSTSIFIMVVYDRVLPNEATESLIALTVGIGVALIFDFIIKSIRATFIDRAGQRSDLIMGRLIFEKLLNIQTRARKGSTGAIANTMREFETLRDFITSATLIGLVDLPFIGLFIFVISLVGGPLAVVPAIAVPLVLIIGLAVQPILSRTADKSHSEGQNKQSVLVETISGLDTIKTVGAARVMRKRWDDALATQSDHALRSRAVSQFALNATAFAQQAAQVMIVFYGVFLIQAGTVSMGALIACVILTGRTLAPLAQLAQTMTRFSQARTSFRSISLLMQQPTERQPGRRWLSRPNLRGQIEFRDVSFTYPDKKTVVLSDLSLQIEPGEKVAILGRVGSGKSTIGRLITGLYTADTGQVLVDGTDVSHIDPQDLRNNIGTVLQDVWLFSGTVRENIAVGADRPSDEDIIAAANLAGLHSFIASHPMGYDLQVTERGAALSGGQRQAIALARALVGKKPVLFLDEPTSAMDVQTEKSFIKRLSEFGVDRTIVIVTHRTALLEAVDRVIVMENGRKALDGPKELLTKRSAPGQATPTVVFNAGR